MDESIGSKALEANLAQTRAEDIQIPPDQQTFVELSESHRGINRRTREFIIELNHPYSNLQFVLERWQEIVLRDLWFYTGLETSQRELALTVLVNISHKLLHSALNEDLKGVVIRTLLEFAQNLTSQEESEEGVIGQILEVLQDAVDNDQLVAIHNSRHFNIHLKEVARHPAVSQVAFEITRQVLSQSVEFWESTSRAEDWFRVKKGLFTRDYEDVIKAIGQPYFAELQERVERASDWQELQAIPSFDDIANHFRQTTDSFDSALERIYFTVFLLHLPGTYYLKDSLLLDINRLLRNVHQELSAEQIISFSENLFTLFQELKTDYINTVMDCLLTLGKEVIDTRDQEIIDAFIDSLIQFGFITPGVIRISSDWQICANVHHVKNCRLWMELIEHAPERMRPLLSALIVNLQLEGIFIADTDLFQRDITRLLNSPIGPVYKQIKDLARIFPVYFNEIGAEGELRDVTTRIDEIAHRRDRLIHFLRKQTHTESNASHLELTRKIIRFWYDGSTEPLIDWLPADVLDSIDLKDEWFVPVHEIVRELCKRMGCSAERLLELAPGVVEGYLNSLEGYEERDKDRIRLLTKIHSLLGEKYSLEMGDVFATLKKSHVFSSEDLDQLILMQNDNDTAGMLKQVYQFMARLKDVVLNPEPGEAAEVIYHKRHVAAGIPSMYGRYSEPKFEALGLTFRLENLASRLMEQIIADINLNYITTRNLKRIAGVLSLIREGMEIDGITHERFNSNLEMLEASFTSASCSLNQYTNIFEFLERNVKEIIEEYFLHPYDQPLRMIIPQHIPQRHQLPEPEIRQALHQRSEEFYRKMLSSAFLIQTLDNFISHTLSAIRSTSDNFSIELVHDVMTYDPELAISSLTEPSPHLDNQIFLGAKAYFLKAMYTAGFPVPEGFILTTEVFRHRLAIMNHPSIQEEIERMIWHHIAKLEAISGYEFGNPRNPLLLSVRSGTAMSMPGAMSTILNVGINDEIAEGLSRQPKLGRTAWDCYRRFLQSWGMAYGMERDIFDSINSYYEFKHQIGRNTDFTGEQMKDVALEYKNLLRERDVDIKDDPFSQLKEAIIIVMDSWSSDRAKVYREHLQIADEWGTAVLIQKMILGNISERSGTGVLLTHDPYERKPGINPYGDFRICSQGEDVVTGWLHTLPLTEKQRTKYEYDLDISLQSAFPQVYGKLLGIASQLVEKYDLGPQEIEFTFEGDRAEDLYLLQTRRQDVQKSDKRPVFSTPPEQMELVGRGIGIGGGALSGMLAFDMKDLEELKELQPNRYRILVRRDTVPDDIGMVFNCDGLLTGKGGATSHAAVTAARLGKVCIVGCKDLLIDEAARTCSINGVQFKSGDEVSIEGYLGNIYRGTYPTSFVDIT